VRCHPRDGPVRHPVTGRIEELPRRLSRKFEDLSDDWQDRINELIEFAWAEPTHRRASFMTDHARTSGTVIRLVRDKGFGFLRAVSGIEYFFHRSSVTSGSFDTLSEGDAVMFDPVEGQKGPRAERVAVS
jgi:cold shock CspA family protein